MVNNSLNINKTKYQLPPQIIEHKKKTTTDDVEYSVLALGQTQKCGSVKPVKGIPVNVCFILYIFGVFFVQDRLSYISVPSFLLYFLAVHSYLIITSNSH